MNDFNSRDLHRRLDLAGALERVAKKERVREERQQAQADLDAAAETYRAALQAVRKQEQTPQEIAYESPAARERGLRSYDPARHRHYDVAKLKELQERDPVLFFFRFANTSVDRA